jgi:4-hydroxy-tetrahydrodipicolinate reductase
MIRICLAGATGKVGRGLLCAIERAEDLQLSSAVARRAAGEALGGVKIVADVGAALDSAKADVLVDYTRADAVKRHVLAAVQRGVHAVVGTSGLTDEDYAEIDRAARAAKVAVFAAGNFALTAVLLQRFAVMAAEWLPSWEIIDYAYPGKPDAPSGTARELASKLAAVRTAVVERPVAETLGHRDARGATLGGAQLHSVRMHGFSSSAEVVFGLPGERLTIRHDSIDPTEPYVGGTLLAVRRVASLVGVTRGLDKLLDEPPAQRT